MTFCFLNSFLSTVSTPRYFSLISGINHFHSPLTFVFHLSKLILLDSVPFIHKSSAKLNWLSHPFVPSVLIIIILISSFSYISFVCQPLLKSSSPTYILSFPINPHTFVLFQTSTTDFKFSSPIHLTKPLCSSIVSCSHLSFH